MPSYGGVRILRGNEVIGEASSRPSKAVGRVLKKPSIRKGYFDTEMSLKEEQSYIKMRGYTEGLDGELIEVDIAPPDDWEF